MGAFCITKLHLIFQLAEATPANSISEEVAVHSSDRLIATRWAETGVKSEIRLGLFQGIFFILKKKIYISPLLIFPLRRQLLCKFIISLVGFFFAAVTTFAQIASLRASCLLLSPSTITAEEAEHDDDDDDDKEENSGEDFNLC